MTVRRDINWKRDRIRIWEDRGERHFTEHDIPEWVMKNLEYDVFTPNGKKLGEIYRYLISVKHYTTCIFVVDDVVHFNLDGYKKIIDYVERRECMRQNYIDQWRQEVFEKS